jgi:hypothetical protein
MLLTLLCLMSSAAITPGDVVLFRGAPGASGDVVIVDATGAQPPSTPPELQAITLKRIDFNARTALSQLDANRPRLREDVPGANRIELPSHAGSLYHYARNASGVVVHGLFVVDASGEARSVIEMPGVGPALDQSPFLAQLAVAPAGDRILVATKFAAGGDLLEIELATGVAIDRTPSLGPQRFVPSSLYLDSTWGIGATPTDVLRFDASTSGAAQPLTFPGAKPAWFSGEIALSNNRLHAVTTAGASIDLAHVFAFDPSGDAVQVTSQPAFLSGAGFLPGSLHGPYLAISDSGSQCAWRSEGATREAFLGAVPQAQPAPALQITQSPTYLDTLDEVGQFIFRIGLDRLVLAVGEASGTGAPTIENLDIYQVTAASVGPVAISNVTLSNGLAQPPFNVASSLDPGALLSAPASDAVIFFNQLSGGSGELLSASPTQPGLTVLVPDVKSIDFIERCGSDVLVALRRSIGPKDRELYRVSAPYTQASSVLLTIPSGDRFERPTPRFDGTLAFVQSKNASESLWRLPPLAPQPTLFTHRPLSYGPTLAFTPSGDLAFSVGANALNSIFALWPTTPPVVRLPVPVGPGFVLPGA